MFIFDDMGHIYCYRKKHLLIPNNKILMLPARCIYCYLFCCSPATKINEAPPPKRNKRLIVKAVHDRSTLGTTLGTICKYNTFLDPI